MTKNRAHFLARLGSFSILAGVLLCTTPAMAVSVNATGYPRYPMTDMFQHSEYFDLQQATGLMKAKHYTAALTVLNTALEKSPTNLFVLFDIGYCYSELAKAETDSARQAAYIQQGEQTFQRLQNLTPELMSTYFKLGKLALLRNDAAGAQRYYEAGLAIDPNNAGLLFNLAGLYDQKDETQKAIQYYKQAIQADPNFIYSYNNLGLLLEKTHQPQEAEKIYKMALKLDQGYQFARLNLGNLYTESGRFHEAEKLYREVLNLEPTNAWANLYLGNTYLRQTKYEEAASEYQHFVEKNPTYVSAYYLLAVTLYKLHRFDEAMSAGLMYLGLAPEGEYTDEMKSLVLALKIQKAGGLVILDK